MKILIAISLMTFLLNVILLAYLLKDKYRTMEMRRNGSKKISFQLRPQEESCLTEDTEIPETEILHQRQE